MTDLTRESLAAALRQTYWMPDDIEAAEHAADAILAALPSPAPEPPPGTRKGKEWGEGYSEGWFDASAGFGLAAFFDWAARSPHYSCSMEDEPEGTSRGLHLWHIYRKYHGAAQPAPDPEALDYLRQIVRNYDHNVDLDEMPPIPVDLQASILVARSFLSKSETRESGGEP